MASDPTPTSAFALFQQAMSLHRSGRLDDAEAAYRQVMTADPRDYPSRCMLGRLYMELGRLEDAETILGEAVKIDPRGAPGLSSLGFVMLRQSKFGKAIPVLERAMAADPADWSLRHNLGDALRGLGRPKQAIAAYDQALAMLPNSEVTWGRRAGAQLELGKPEAAISDCGRALHDPEAMAVRAQALALLDRQLEAIVAYAQAIAANPHDPVLRLERARLLLKAGREAEAAAECTAALAQDDANIDALRLRSAALARMRRLEPALADIEAAAALAPGEPEIKFARALRLEDLGRFEDAVSAYDDALALQDKAAPEYADALNNRSIALMELRRYSEAIAGLEQVLTLRPDHPYALGALAQAKLAICDWSGRPELEQRLRKAALEGQLEIPPGTLLAYFDDPQVQLAGASTYARRNMPATAPPHATRAAHDRIRVAYLSADFRNHATARLMIDLFEGHDRSRFDVYGVSFGPDDGSELRARCVAAFETFLDVQGASDAEVAALLREREIDIAVDLKGYTTGARPGIFARRPAPVQVSYLGFPGTLGTQVHDYVLADAVVAPLEVQPAFTEKLVQLPNSYYPTSRMGAPDETPSRAEAGLPETGFVFCTFNNNYKITPAFFDIWIRLLGAVEGSVLWLLEDNADAAANLRKEAAARGVDPQRLVFAPRVSPEAHLARHRLADLFLDSGPYNAHTTATDALWMGLPVLTAPGEAFASRVGASVCRAIGLEELIAPDLGAYEQLALELARDPARLAAIKARLVTERQTQPLFDTERFRRGVEAAFGTIWARWRAGEPAAPLAAPVA